MSNEETIAQLFDLAIAAERFGESLYRGLAARFAHNPEVADFWQTYAEEEVQHAQWLEQIRQAASPEVLATPADPQMLKEAQKILSYSLDSVLAGITNLQDAYQLVVEAETTESNAVFSFLIEHLTMNETTREFVRAQLREHLDVASRFPTRFRSARVRQAVEALES